MTRKDGLNFSARMPLPSVFRPKVNWWRGFGGTGAPPAIVVVWSRRKTAGGTPALRNRALCNETCGDNSDHSNREEVSGPGD
jgi:hypothetical protein